jgi:hypothetical protein
MLLPEVTAGHLRFLILNAAKRTHAHFDLNCRKYMSAGADNPPPRRRLLHAIGSSKKKLRAEG